jgi:hypothetical protein
MIYRPLPRRTFLKGLGTTMALPLLEAMLPTSSFAAAADRIPTRMACVFFPNGAIMPSWKASGAGSEFEFSASLKPLQRHRQDLLLFSGLTQHHGRANGDGPGDHARNASVFLTGCQPTKTAGDNIHVGISVDQIAAQKIGYQTNLPSLELGLQGGRNAGSCDSGYSCAYSSNISWRTPSTPMAKETIPQSAFRRLFGDPGDRQRNHVRKSILDLVHEDASDLQRRLGEADRRKLDEYLTCVHELERRVERAEVNQQEVPEFDVPDGIPPELEVHMQLMYDIMALAFQTDATRIITFMLGDAGSNRTYPMVDVHDGHHELSHHKNNETKIEKLARIDHYLTSQFSRFLDRLKSIQEADQTLLDHCMILYGSAIADGNRHSHDDLPILLAGKGGGTIRTGKHLRHPNETPLNNLFLSMLDRMGAGPDQLGDSTGRLALA